MLKLLKTNKCLRAEVNKLKRENIELHKEAQRWHNKYFGLKKSLLEFCEEEFDENHNGRS